MQTLVIIPVDPEALEDSAVVQPTNESDQLSAFKQSDLKLHSPNKETELSSSSFISQSPAPQKSTPPLRPTPLLRPSAQQPPDETRPTFGRPVPVNSLTVKKFHPMKRL